MVLVQKCPFYKHFFQAIQARKMSFKIFQSKKTSFQALKSRSSNSRKIEIFPKGLTHGFGPKMAIFPTFFSRQCRPIKCLLRYFTRRSEKPFQDIKTRSSKSRKFDIFPKGLTHGFIPKVAIFPTIFFKAIQARIICFTILQNDKTPFQAMKTRSSKSRKK